MKTLGNFLWFICGGLLSGLSWALAGILWCVSIVGIPVGIQCFKISRLCFFPFEKAVIPAGGFGSMLLNLIWIATTGLALATESATMGLLCCATIVGIPFGKQHFKIAQLALSPFGTRLV